MMSVTTVKTAIFGSLWGLQESPSLCLRRDVRLLFSLKTNFSNYIYLAINGVQMSTISLENTTIITYIKQ
jgi:hypothetical protein